MLVSFMATAVAAAREAPTYLGIAGSVTAGGAILYLGRYAIDKLAAKSNNGSGTNGRVTLGEIKATQTHCVSNLLEIRQDQDQYNSDMLKVMRDIHQSIKDNGVLIAASKEHKG